MTDCAAGTVDSQGIELHVTGAPLFPSQVLIADVLDLPLPAGERPTDDVTAPSREASKKNRVALTIAISGAVDHLENGVSVLVDAPEVPAG